MAGSPAASAIELVDQVDAIVGDLTAQNAELQLLLAKKTAEAADLDKTCQQLQSAASTGVQATMQQLLTADQQAGLHLQRQHAQAVTNLITAKARVAELQAALSSALSELAAVRASAAEQQVDAQRQVEAQGRKLSAEISRLQAEQVAAASSSSRQLEALQAEKQQLLLTLDQERRANAIASAARSDAGWKAKLMTMKAEADRLRSERDKYKQMCPAA